MHNKSNNGEGFLVIFRKIQKKRNAYIKNNLQNIDLSSNEIDVITFISRNKKYNTAKDIVEYIGVSKGLVSRSIDSLIKKGLITTKEDIKDKRIIRLYINESTNSVFKQIEKLDSEFFEIISQGVIPSDIAALNKIISTMETNLLKFL